MGFSPEGWVFPLVDGLPIELRTNARRNTANSSEERTACVVSMRILAWAVGMWRPAGTAVAVALALLMTWHVIHGKHGLSVWQQERTEDKLLQQQIQDLQHENAAMRDQIEKLKSDPDAIEHEAREKLHYAKPGEVIYALPDKTQTLTPQAGN